MARTPAPVSIFEAARARPRTIAIEDGDEQVDYGTLVGRALATAVELRELGVRPDTLVAVCLPRSADQIIAMLAAWCAGAAYLPLDPSWPEARLSALVADADCAALLAAPDLGARIAGRVPLGGVSSQTADFGEAVVPVRPDALAYVIYTSGSTGAPKAVEVEHRNLAALIAWHREAFAIRADSPRAILPGSASMPRRGKSGRRSRPERRFASPTRPPGSTPLRCATGWLSAVSKSPLRLPLWRNRWWRWRGPGRPRCASS